MTSKQRKTMMEKITKHGNQLLQQFGGDNPPISDPVKLCKKLRRLENKLSVLHCENCNEGVPYDVLDRESDKATAIICGLLPELPEHAIHINRDPRGYALKIDDEYMRSSVIGMFNPRGICMDFGGYGILAPDFTPDN